MTTQTTQPRNSTISDRKVLQPEFITPSGYACGMEGVWLTDPHLCDVPKEQILDHPLWLSEIVRSAETGEYYAVIEWIDRWEGHRRDLMPLYRTAKSIEKWLLRHFIFASDPKRHSKPSNYVLQCIWIWQQNHQPREISDFKVYARTIRQ